MQKSLIEWTESTWNPITGCTKISDGCLNCYAEKMAKRLQAMGQKKYKNGFKLTLHPENIEDPLKIKKSQMIFVCSMSDIFHEEVPEDFILKLFEIMNKAHWHIFQVLTKRADRLQKIATKINWTKNIWVGVTVESQKYMNRIYNLQKTDAYIKFISIEPMLENIENIPLNDIDWVIVGGESGYNARPIKKEWVENILEQCKRNNVPFFFKQWGGVNKKKNGRLLNGKTYDEMPLKFTQTYNSLF